MKKYNISKKILFLDIDGVLNGRYKKYKADFDRRVERTMDELKFLSDVYNIDKDKLKMLNDVVSECGFSVVLSSCWRLGSTTEYINKVFLEAGATFEIIDFTPSLTVKGGSGLIPRGLEINDWIDANIKTTYYKENNERQYLPYTNYAILDDECIHMFQGQIPQTFKCDFETGLTESICYRMKLKYSSMRDTLTSY